MTDAQSLIITQAINAGSSSTEAYALAFPTKRRTNAIGEINTNGNYNMTGSSYVNNTNFNNYTYIKSSATVQKTYSTNSYQVLNPSGLKHDYTTPIMVASDYVFTNDLDLVYGTDSAVSVVNNFINQTSSSFASAIVSLIPNYQITGSFANDAEAAICLVPTGSLYRTAAGALRVKIS